MIYTLTFNPSIDYVMQFEKVEAGRINRAIGEYYTVGGKGINVSVVLKRLGIDSVALGFCAGFTGDALTQMLEAEGVQTDFISLKDGFTRICVKVKSDDETDFNGQGPNIDSDALAQLVNKLQKLQKGDTLIVSGSVPNSVSLDCYERIFKAVKEKEIILVADTAKELLEIALKYNPFLVKPNNFELSELFEVEIKTTQEIIDYSKKLLEMGAKNVLVSRAKDGAVLIDEHGNVHTIKAARGKTVNSVGAGDSMVAGFVAGYIKTADYDYALKLGSAAGSATAFSQGLAEKGKIYEVLDSLNG